MMKLNRKGFTLVEIMIVVAIIGLLAAIAIPNFVTARSAAQRTACLANQRTLTSAATLCDFDGNWDATDISGSLVPNYINAMPVCPSGGTYSATGVVVSCDFAGH